MKNKEFKTQVLVFLNQPDTAYLYDKAVATKDPAILLIYLKKAKRIWATNISDADQLINESKTLENAQ